MRGALALVCVAALGCRANEGARPAEGAPDGAASAPVVAARPRAVGPFVAIAREAARDARAAAVRLGARLASTCSYGEDFFSLRRAVARGKGLFRIASARGAEVLLGPVRSTSEVGGALAQLDFALGAGDCATARDRWISVERALTLIDVELDVGLPDSAVARSLSEAAFELGAVIAGSSQEIATTDEGVLADAAGLLDGIERVASAFEAIRPEAAGLPPAELARRPAWRALHAELRRAVDAGPLRDRARIVLTTGDLGASLRTALAARGVSVKPPFLPRVPTQREPAEEAISVFSLPAPKVPVDPRRAALGKKLFYDARLSEGEQRACSSCHQPARGFADGLRVPRSLDPATPLSRNTPTLLYAAPQAAFLWDGRVATTWTQALGVLHAKAEMGIGREALERRLKADDGYRAAFAEAFPDGVSAENVGRALGAYEDAELVQATAPIDRFARGDRGALDERMRAGFDVFAGVGRCARCHVPPLFGGTRPTDFAIAIYSAIGSPTTPNGRALDPDPGRGGVTGARHDQGAFKVPHLRELGRTAPYFHNGAFATLEAVVDFYDHGGGAGLGLDVPNQDPDVRPLRLSPADRRNLLVFLREALRDAP